MMSEQKSFSPAGIGMFKGLAVDTTGIVMLLAGLAGYFHTIDALDAYKWPLIIFGAAGMLLGANMMIKSVALMKQQAEVSESNRKAKS